MIGLPRSTYYYRAQEGSVTLIADTPSSTRIASWRSSSALCKTSCPVTATAE